MMILPVRDNSTRSMMSTGSDLVNTPPKQAGDNPTEAECMALRPEDVICTKGRITKNHPGNMRYDAMIQQNRERYQACQFRGDKTRITHEIIDTVTESGGRFLKFDSESREWSELTKNLQREKVSHALRSSRRSSLSSTGKTNKRRASSSSSRGSVTSASLGNVVVDTTTDNTMTSEENERVQAVFRAQQEILRRYHLQAEDESFSVDDSLST